MTLSEKQHELVEGVIESLWLKGGARGAMIVALPLIFWLGNREIAAIDRLIERQNKLETTVQLIEQSQVNDRATMRIIGEEAQKRLDLVFGRINTLPTQPGVDKDLLLRDQRIDGLDRRVGVIEGRIYNPSVH